MVSLIGLNTELVLQGICFLESKPKAWIYEEIAGYMAVCWGIVTDYTWNNNWSGQMPFMPEACTPKHSKSSWLNACSIASRWSNKTSLQKIVQNTTLSSQVTQTIKLFSLSTAFFFFPPPPKSVIGSSSSWCDVAVALSDQCDTKLSSSWNLRMGGFGVLVWFWIGFDSATNWPVERVQ